MPVELNKLLRLNRDHHLPQRPTPSLLPLSLVLVTRLQFYELFFPQLPLLYHKLMNFIIPIYSYTTTYWSDFACYSNDEVHLSIFLFDFSIILFFFLRKKRHHWNRLFFDYYFLYHSLSSPGLLNPKLWS